jgi:hypothetical protein
MKTDFSINVSINLGLTNELVSLVKQLYNGASSQILESKPEGVRERKKSSKEEKAEATPEPVAKSETAKPKEKEVKEKAKEEAASKRTYTAVDVRAAMHNTRSRIEGEDYKENIDGEGRKKYHKALTSQFISIANMLGADKPSALPEDKRAEFINSCDQLKVLADGTIGSDVPF